MPLTAVNERTGAPWVLRVRDGKTERVEVTLGLRDAQTERVEIAAGVAEGDVLLVGASQGMTPGTPREGPGPGARRLAEGRLTCSSQISSIRRPIITVVACWRWWCSASSRSSS